MFGVYWSLEKLSICHWKASLCTQYISDRTSQTPAWSLHRKRNLTFHASKSHSHTRVNWHCPSFCHIFCCKRDFVVVGLVFCCGVPLIHHLRTFIILRKEKPCSALILTSFQILISNLQLSRKLNDSLICIWNRGMMWDHCSLSS